MGPFFGPVLRVVAREQDARAARPDRRRVAGSARRRRQGASRMRPPWRRSAPRSYLSGECPREGAQKASSSSPRQPLERRQHHGGQSS
eukprot:4006954-Pyramimonas_sp.AAC.1